MQASRRTTLLPDFCSLPVLFVLLLLAAVVALIMLLAPGSLHDLADYSTAVLFAVWLALIIAVLLCRLSKLLVRVPPWAAYGAIWLLMLLVVVFASAVVAWLDQRLGTGLTPLPASRFVLGNGMVAGLIGALLLRYFHVLAQWQDRTRAVAQARSEALQARIRPHFLFNSMNTVIALVRLDPNAAERTIENLSELFRAALGADGKSGTLGEELDLVDRYLAIEQLRLGDRLEVVRELESVPRDMPLPRLLLQPLVENAVYHGVQSRREGGSVRIASRIADDMLELVIENPLSQNSVGNGHGHAQDNVRHRIEYYYAGRGVLETETVAGRYRVTVRLPLGDRERQWTF